MSWSGVAASPLAGEARVRRGACAGARTSRPRRRGWQGSTRRADLAGAIRRLRGVTERLPLLGVRRGARRERNSPRGARPRVARRSRWSPPSSSSQRAAGVDVDVDVAVYEADHGSPRRAVEARTARLGAQAPSVRSADALGWALTRSGKAAGGSESGPAARSRLGSVDPVWRAHAGLSALAAGRVEEGRKQLRHRIQGTVWTASPGKRSVSVTRCGDPRRRSWRYRRP